VEGQIPRRKTKRIIKHLEDSVAIIEIYIYQFNVAYYININISGLLLIYSNNVHAPTFYASYVDSEKILMIAAR